MSKRFVSACLLLPGFPLGKYRGRVQVNRPAPGGIRPVMNDFAKRAGLTVALAVAVLLTADTNLAIDNYAFKPPTITVCAGKTLSWKNNDDDPHTVTALDGSWDSKGLGQSDTYKHTFDKPGKCEYYCKAHPFMRGVIIVKECER